MSDLDPVLVRQLRKLGLEGVSAAPELTVFQTFVKRVDETYKRSKDDRDMLTRSLELSTAEMTQLQHNLVDERDRMEQVVVAVSDGLGAFQEIARSRGDGDTDVTATLQRARRKFNARLQHLFAGGGGGTGSWTSQTTPSSSQSNASVERIRMSFVSLADQLVGLLQQTAEFASVRKELEVAGAVQQMLIPPEDTISRKFLEVAAAFKPATECGGDWWAAHDLPDGRFLLAIGDVTGHGAAAAMITGVAKGACDVTRALTRSSLTPDGLLNAMNGAIFEAGRQRMMMSCLAVIIDPAAGTASVANAGHLMPWILRNGEAKPIVVRGSPLGASGVADHPVTTVEFGPGDTLFLWTDGVTELEDARGGQFGERRLRALCTEKPWRDPRALRTRLLEAIDQHRGEVPAGDDITFLIATPL